MHNVEHMLQTAQAKPDQSLQQELAIFHALPTVTKTKKKKSLPFCKNLNADTHSNPDKNALTVDSKTQNNSIFVTRTTKPPVANRLLLSVAEYWLVRQRSNNLNGCGFWKVKWVNIATVSSSRNVVYYLR